MFRLWDPPPSHPPGMDISSQLFYPQEREQITEIDSTVVPWQAWLAQSHRDETSRQHRPFQRHSCMFFFNLDVLFCFCILHPPAASENTRTADSLASPPSSRPLITPLQTRPQCPRLCAIRGPHIWVCDIRGSRRRQWGGETEGAIEREGEWIDGWREDSQRDDRRWIKGEIERDCRQRAVWQCYSAAAELHTSLCVWHPPCCGLNTQQSVSTDKLVTHTLKHRHFKGETCQYPMSSKFLMASRQCCGENIFAWSDLEVDQILQHHWLP